MMEWVLDASVALAWALPDENSQKADLLLSLEDSETVFYVPALWWYEVGNALVVAYRRNRITETHLFQILGLYDRLPLKTETSLTSERLWRLCSLAREYALSVYDAAYLDLAHQLGVGLATFDLRLRSAAKKAGLRIFE